MRKLESFAWIGIALLAGTCDTHVGILSDPAALAELSRVLDATTGSAKSTAVNP